VMRGGQVLHLQGYGWADIAGQVPVTEHSAFDLASVSKQMVALAARMQMQAGLYGPQTPVAQLLPELAQVKGGAGMTVDHLIHHLSGLPDYLEWPGYAPSMKNADILAWLSGQEVLAEPGARFDYSNTGYVVLGSLVAAADGLPDLAAVLRARIWVPRGMQHTGMPQAAPSARRVTGYAGRQGQFVPSIARDLVQGDGNVITTLADLARYEAGFWQGRYLPDAAVLFQNGRDKAGQMIRDDGDGYGYGWVLSADGEYADHSGGWAGTSTYYLRNLKTGLAVILLANGEDAELGELAAEIEAALPE
jgi:CubicO group peptidase (beta-lactamase class C family)